MVVVIPHVDPGLFLCWYKHLLQEAFENTLETSFFLSTMGHYFFALPKFGCLQWLTKIFAIA
jgi:hypothetical protein